MKSFSRPSVNALDVTQNFDLIAVTPQRAQDAKIKSCVP